MVKNASEVYAAWSWNDSAVRVQARGGQRRASRRQAGARERMIEGALPRPVRSTAAMQAVPTVYVYVNE